MNKGIPPLQILMIETTTRCNSRCVHCRTSEENATGDFVRRDLSKELFEKMIPIMREFRPIVRLNGEGEALLHPDFVEMTGKAASLGCAVMFMTNGMLLSPRIVERIVGAGIAQIGISIDATNPELFGKIRRGVRPARVIENISYINKTKQRLGVEHPELTFRFVVMRQNVHELPSVVKMAGELAVAEIAVDDLVEYNLTQGQSLAGDPLMANRVFEAEAEARRLGIRFLRPRSMFGTTGTPVDGDSSVAAASAPANSGLRKACREPWERMFVRVNGEVPPCNRIGECHGNLNAQSFEEVWYGPTYEMLRAALLTDSPPANCAGCTLHEWQTIDAGLTGDEARKALVNALEDRDSRIKSLLAEMNRINGSRDWLLAEINRLYGLRDSLLADINRLDGARNTLAEVNRVFSSPDRLLAELNRTYGARDSLLAELNNIHGSRGWKALSMYYGLKNRVFPRHSKREATARALWKWAMEAGVAHRGRKSRG